MSESRSIDQERAAYAWKAVGEAGSKDYVNLAKGAPALIMSNGLMQTLAFYKSKGKEHAKLLDHVIAWLGQAVPEIPDEASFEQAMEKRFEQAMEKLQEGSSDLYIRATEEALEILRWIRQFAAARQKA